MTKLAILLPHRDNMDYRAWRDWYHFGLQKPDGTTFMEINGLPVNLAREKMINDVLKGDSEWIFFLDDDLICPNNIILQMMSYNLPICCGLYWAKKKKSERGLAAWMKAPDNVYNGPWSRLNGYIAIEHNVIHNQQSKLIQVDVTGLGCALIKREVIEKLSTPRFDWQVEKSSEDFAFFEKCERELNIFPVIDTTMQCRHIGVFSIEPDGSFEAIM